jgi:hypothetical protein
VQVDEKKTERRTIKSEGQNGRKFRNVFSSQSFCEKIDLALWGSNDKTEVRMPVSP